MKKILIIRFSSIGDIVLTSPVVRCVKQQLIGAEVHYLTKTKFKSILENNPNIDKIYSIDKNISEVIDELKKENYDFIIDLHHNLRSYITKFSLKKPSGSFNKLNFEKWILVNLKINLLPKIHIVDRYFKAAEKLKITNDLKGLDFFIPKEDEVDLNTLPEIFRNRYIGFVIGGLKETKRFPIEKVISVCNKTDKPIILLGGKEDFEDGEKIIYSTKGNVFNACGKYNLNQSASLLKQASKIITNDTGLMHISSSFKKDIISLWGNTIHEFGMNPYLPGEKSKIIEVENLKCRPCSKLGFKKCPKNHFNCMNLIDENLIISNF